jgi:hypothetical protein
MIALVVGGVFAVLVTVVIVVLFTRLARQEERQGPRQPSGKRPGAGDPGGPDRR